MPDLNRALSVNDGISFNDYVFMFEGTIDPTDGAGLSAPLGSIYLKYNSPSGYYFKYGTSDTDWKDLNNQSGLTENEHKLLNQLVHNLSENSYLEINRTNGLVSSEIYWTDNTKTQKIREFLYIRSNGLVSEIIIKQYDDSGVLTETETQTISRTFGLISSIDIVKS